MLGAVTVLRFRTATEIAVVLVMSPAVVRAALTVREEIDCAPREMPPALFIVRD